MLPLHGRDDGGAKPPAGEAFELVEGAVESRRGEQDHGRSDPTGR
jgi:hypothetical protein